MLLHFYVFSGKLYPEVNRTGEIFFTNLIMQETSLVLKNPNHPRTTVLRIEAMAEAEAMGNSRKNNSSHGTTANDTDSECQGSSGITDVCM